MVPEVLSEPTKAWLGSLDCFLLALLLVGAVYEIVRLRRVARRLAEAEREQAAGRLEDQKRFSQALMDVTTSSELSIQKMTLVLENLKRH